MLTPYKIKDYCEEYKPSWAIQMPDGCPPEDVFVPSEHPFYRLAKQSDNYSADDFKSYAEAAPGHNWVFYYLWLLVFQLLTTRKKPERT